MLQNSSKVCQRYFWKVPITKDVIFDSTINFKSDLEKDLPTIGDFNNIPSLELVHNQDNTDAPRRQLIVSPATQEVKVPDLIDVLTPHVETSTASSLHTSDPYLPPDADEYSDADIGTEYDEEGNIQYWHNMKYNLSTQVKTGDQNPAEFSRVILETRHWRSNRTNLNHRPLISKWILT